MRIAPTSKLAAARFVAKSTALPTVGVLVSFRLVAVAEKMPVTSPMKSVTSTRPPAMVKMFAAPPWGVTAAAFDT
jgi:hypothetical protein